MLIRQTLLYLPAQLLSPLVQFASVLIWSHLLAPEDLGVVTLMVAIQEVAYMAFFGWWSLFTLRFIAGYTDRGERPDYLRTENLAIGGSLLAQVAVMVPTLLIAFGAALPPASIALALVFMVSRSINNYNADRARAEANIVLYSLVQLLGPVIGFGFGLLCIWRFGSSPEAVLGGFVVAQLIGAGLGIAMSDFCRGKGRPSRAILRTALGFGGTVTTAQLLAVLAINAPRFIVGRELGLAAVGMFSVGYSLGIRASSFAVTLVTAGAYPLVVKKMETEGREAAFRQLSQNMVLVALAVAPVAFGLLAINRSFVGLLVDPKFQAATLVVLPLATLGGLFRYLRAHTSDQVFLLNLKPKYSTLIAVSDIIVAVASAFIGIRLFGLVGAALGPMVSGMVTFTLSFVLSRWRFGYRAPFGAFARILLAAVVMAGVIYALPVARNVPLMLGYVALGGVVFVGVVMLAMPREAKALRAMTGKLGRRFAKGKR